MNQFNQLIIYLLAIQNYAKDLHYSVYGEAFYGMHLFADRIYDPIADFIDDIKEKCLLFEQKEPLPSNEYLKEASLIIPDRTDNNVKNWDNMRELHIKVLVFIESMNELSPGEANLIGNIAETLNQNLGLLNLQCDRIINM